MLDQAVPNPLSEQEMLASLDYIAVAALLLHLCFELLRQRRRVDGLERYCRWVHEYFRGQLRLASTVPGQELPTYGAQAWPLVWQQETLGVLTVTGLARETAEVPQTFQAFLQVCTLAIMLLRPEDLPAVVAPSPTVVPHPVATLPLSERELHILSAMLTHPTQNDLARAMTVSPHTVRTHLEHIYRKLGVNTLGEAVQRAWELGAWEGSAPPKLPPRPSRASTAPGPSQTKGKQTRVAQKIRSASPAS